MITKKDLETMQEVIREEGLRRDIGMLIDQNTAGGFKLSAGSGIVKNILLMLGLSSLVTIIAYQFFKDGKPENNQIATGQKYTESEQENVLQLAQPGEIYNFKIKDRLGKTKQEKIIEVDTKESIEFGENQLGLKASLAITDTIVEQRAPIITNHPASDAADKSESEIRVKNRKTEKIGITNDALMPTSNTSSIPIPSNSKKSEILDAENNIVPEYIGVVAESRSKKNNLSNRTDPTDSYPIEVNAFKINFPDFISPTANDYLAAFDSSQIRSSFIYSDSTRITGSKDEKRFDATVGFGYGFLSTGDINTLALSNELNYRHSPRFAISFSGGLGQSFFNSSPDPVGASYLKGEFNLYYSPFKNTSIHDFRIGFGPAAYQISHTYIEGSSIIDGEVTYDFVFEQRKSFGISFNLGYRYQLSDQFLIGIKLNSQRYLNGDAIAGVLPTIGIRF